VVGPGGTAPQRAMIAGSPHAATVTDSTAVSRHCAGPTWLGQRAPTEWQAGVSAPSNGATLTADVQAARGTATAASMPRRATSANPEARLVGVQLHGSFTLVSTSRVKGACSWTPQRSEGGRVGGARWARSEVDHRARRGPGDVRDLLDSRDHHSPELIDAGCLDAGDDVVGA